MPSTTDYYTQLKTQLEASAAAKKAALDLEYERATTATFDAQGNPTYKKDAAGNTQYGSIDVGYMNQQSNIKTGAESGNMLKSGQTARSLLTSTAGYKAELAGKAADIAAQKTAVTNDTQTELAKYMAMYGSGSAGAGASAGASAGAGAGTGANADTSTGLDEPEDAVVKTNVIPQKTYTNMTPAEKAAVAARNKVSGGMGATAKAPAKTPAKTPAIKVPIPNKVKTLRP